MFVYGPDASFMQNEYGKNREVLYCGHVQVEGLVYLGKAAYAAAQQPITEHRHEDCFEVTYHLTGGQTYYLNEVPYEVSAGDVLVSFPNEVHKTGQQPEEISSFYFVAFRCPLDGSGFTGIDPAYARYLAEGLHGVKGRCFRGSDELRRLLDAIRQQYVEGTPIRAARIHLLFAEFVYMLLALSRGASAALRMPEDIRAVVDYIEARPYEDISVDQLARMAGASRQYFFRKFKRYTGETPHNYILRERVHLAADMLKYTHIPVVDIAMELGFSSSQHFSTVFKRYKRLSPLQYRKAKGV